MFSGKLHLSTKAILGLIVLMLFASTLLLQSEVFRKPTYSWNQKVTITVETEEGVFSSYTVQRVEWKYNGPSRPGLEKNYWSMTLHGEAPFVVLPDETVIVATLGGGDRWGFGRLLIEELEGSDYNSSLSPSEEVVQRVEVASDLNTYVYSPTQVPPIIIGISPSKSPQNSFWVSPEDQTSEALGITSVKI